MSDTKAEDWTLRRYGRWTGNPKGKAYRPDWCAHEIITPMRGAVGRQCSRKGIHSGYCLEHARRAGIAVVRLSTRAHSTSKGGG
jgi:hypothetical protein